MKKQTAGKEQKQERNHLFQAVTVGEENGREHAQKGIIRRPLIHLHQSHDHLPIGPATVKKFYTKKWKEKSRRISQNTHHRFAQNHSRLLSVEEARKKDHQNKCRLQDIGETHHAVQSQKKTCRQQKKFPFLPHRIRKRARFLRKRDHVLWKRGFFSFLSRKRLQKEEGSQCKKEIGQIIIQNHPRAPAETNRHPLSRKEESLRHPFGKICIGSKHGQDHRQRAPGIHPRHGPSAGQLCEKGSQQIGNPGGKFPHGIQPVQIHIIAQAVGGVSDIQSPSDADKGP